MTPSAPVIGSAIGGIGQHLQHDHKGLVAPAGDASALARAIDRVLADPESAARLGGNASEYASAAFDVRALARRSVGHVEARLDIA